MRRAISTPTWMLAVYLLGFVSGWAWATRPAAAAAPRADGGYLDTASSGFHGNTGLYTTGSILRFDSAGEEWGHVTDKGEVWVNPKLEPVGQECVRYQLQAWLPKCNPWRAWCR